MATALFIIIAAILWIFPSKYIPFGGFAILVSTYTIFLPISVGNQVFQDWRFWVSVVLAVGCDGFWLKRRLSKR